MKIIPIHNTYKYGNTSLYNTTPIKQVSFNGLFSKSLQENFNDGIAALDESSVFIFTTDKNADSAKSIFNISKEMK